MSYADMAVLSHSVEVAVWQNREKVLNQLNLANWVELHEYHVQESRAGIIHKISNRI